MAKQERTEDLNPHDDDIEEKIRRMLDPRLPDDTLATGEQPVSSIKIVSEHKQIKPKTAQADAADAKTAPELVAAEAEQTGSKNAAIKTSKSDKKTAAEEQTKPADEDKAKKKSKENGAAENTDPAGDGKEPLPPSARRSHKVIVPISDDEPLADEEETKDITDKNISSNSKDQDDAPGDTPELEADETKTPTKISVIHDEEEVSSDNEEPVKIATDSSSDSDDDVAEKLDEAIAELEPDEEAVESEDDLDSEDPADKSEESKPAKGKPESKPKSQKPKKDKKPIKVSVIDEPETDDAVEEIEKAETDKLLELEDKVKKQSEPKLKKTRKNKHLVRRFFKSKALRMLLAAVLLAGFLTALAIPQYRYAILNYLGVRVSSSVTVRDTTTGQPLKGATVEIAGQKAETDENGYAELSGLVQGKTTLKIERIAFAPHEEPLTLGWGSNPLGDRELTPDGIQYEISVIDYLSGKGIEGAQASSGDSSARSNEKGEIKLTIPETKETDITINITAPGYRDEKVKVAFDTTKLPAQKMVPERKHVFVDKSSGRYDIFSMYIDGKDKKMVLKASGYESDDMVILPHPSVNRVAYVSTRSNKFDDYANQKYSLLILDTNENSSLHVVTERQIRLLGWSGSHLVYIETGGEEETPNKSRLMTYNYLTNEAKEISKTSYFNDVLLAGDKVYFAPSSTAGEGDKAEFFVANADGTDKKSLFSGEVWKIFRNNYTDLALSAKELWYRYTLGSGKVDNLDDVPANRINRVYVEGPDNGKAAWLDDTLAEPVLKLYDKRAKADQEISSKTGTSYPIVWLDAKTLIFRVDTASDTADYAVSIEGGEVIKVTNTVQTGNVENWYFY